MQVAIKQLPIAAATEGSIRAAERELIAMFKTSRQLVLHVVELLAYHRSDAHMYLVMERCDMSLSQRCREFKCGRLPTDDWVCSRAIRKTLWHLTLLLMYEPCMYASGQVC